MSKLPPRPILEGLYYGARLRQLDIAAWYGVTGQAISFALRYGRLDWEPPKRQWMRRKRRDEVKASNGRHARPYLMDEDDQVTWRFNGLPALPPQSVLNVWRRRGWTPERMAQAGEEFAR